MVFLKKTIKRIALGYQSANEALNGNFRTVKEVGEGVQKYADVVGEVAEIYDRLTKHQKDMKKTTKDLTTATTFQTTILTRQDSVQKSLLKQDQERTKEAEQRLTQEYEKQWEQQNQQAFSTTTPEGATGETDEKKDKFGMPCPEDAIEQLDKCGDVIRAAEEKRNQALEAGKAMTRAFQTLFQWHRFRHRPRRFFTFPSHRLGFEGVRTAWGDLDRYRHGTSYSKSISKITKSIRHHCCGRGPSRFGWLGSICHEQRNIQSTRFFGWRKQWRRSR